MKILLKQVKILDQNSLYNGKTLDVLIENGIIQAIEKEIRNEDATVISSPALHVSVGWVDIKSSFCDPGFEHKETIEDGLDSAAAGGFTHVCSLPNTFPICDNKTIIEYQLTKSSNHAVKLHPMGTITKGMKGHELSEMYDMYQAGASLFSDDINPLNSGMLHRALLYAKNIGATLLLAASDEYLSKNTVVNEGIASTRTGLKADPAVSEVIQVEKIIRLLEYTEGKAHISGISCKESVKIIEEAKSRGISLTCDVNLMNIIFTENDVLEFNSLMKVLPVLRSIEDRDYMVKALDEGVIDAIASDHRPVDAEEKELEFDHAAFGSFQLQTLFSALNTYSALPIEKIINILSDKNREIAKIDKATIEVGHIADLTIFDPFEKSIYTENSLLSRHKYSPFLNKDLKGKIYGILRANDCIIMDTHE